MASTIATMTRRILITLFAVSGICIFLRLYAHIGLYDVVEVFDGDTIAVAMAGRVEKVRLIGVDTPETKDPRKPVQCYGPEASAFSHSKLDRAKVRLVSDPLSTNRDRYDRLLRYVYLQDGTLYNKQLLSTGNARTYTGFAFSKSQEFVVAETQSKQQNTGLWQRCT
ncbi:hypothetical protein EBS40_01415 [bacterium]|nr:hypothetical protein [bacterium]